MDFKFSEEQELFRRTASRFADKEIAPLVDELERREEFPPELLKRMGELGFLGIPYPEKYGGSGGDVVSLCIFLEELTRVSPAVAGAAVVQINGVSGPVFLFGTEDQRQAYLVPSIRGDTIGAIAMTEPGAGSDVAAIRTSAAKEADGYLINGTKIFCTNAGIAHLFFVTAVTGPGKGIKGISIFVVERGTPGLTVSRNIEKLGLHGLGTYEVIFDGSELASGVYLYTLEAGAYKEVKKMILLK